MTQLLGQNDSIFSYGEIECICDIYTTEKLYLLIYSKRTPQEEFRRALAKIYDQKQCKPLYYCHLEPDLGQVQDSALDSIRKDNTGHHTVSITPRKCDVCKKGAWIQCGALKLFTWMSVSIFFMNDLKAQVADIIY